MKISEMIEQLEATKQRCGDIQVSMKLPYAEHSVSFHMNDHAANWDSPTMYMFPDSSSIVWGLWTDHIKKLVKEDRI